MTPKIVQAFCKAEQQFELYDLLDKCQELLAEHKPSLWSYYYELCKQIKERLILCNKALASNALLGDLGQTSCVNLFEHSEDAE